MERDQAPQSDVVQVCSRMPERPTMPAETTPDRHTEVAANRTVLAAERTVLAAERTYAAWVRTGLVSLAAGVGAKKMLGGVLPDWAVVLARSVLVAFAAFCFIAAVWRELSPGASPPQPDVRQLPRVLLFALNGFLALVALAVLFGVWFGALAGPDPGGATLPISGTAKLFNPSYG